MLQNRSGFCSAPGLSHILPFFYACPFYRLRPSSLSRMWKCVGHNLLHIFTELHNCWTYNNSIWLGCHFRLLGFQDSESFCFFCDHGNSLVGSRCDQRDQIQSMLFKWYGKFFFFFKWYVRQNKSVHPDFCCRLRSALYHKRYHILHRSWNHWYRSFSDECAYHVKYFVGCHAAWKRPYICRLNDRAFLLSDLKMEFQVQWGLRLPLP